MPGATKVKTSEFAGHIIENNGRGVLAGARESLLNQWSQRNTESLREYLFLFSPLDFFFFFFFFFLGGGRVANLSLIEGDCDSRSIGRIYLCA